MPLAWFAKPPARSASQTERYASGDRHTCRPARSSPLPSGGARSSKSFQRPVDIAEPQVEPTYDVGVKPSECSTFGMS
jgi:hypothetical protein